MKKNTKDKEAVQEQVRTGGNSIIIGLSLIFIALGLLLLFVPEVTVTEICYALCGILVAYGIFLIVRYFLTESYKNLSQYGFSFGALMVILGMCALVKAEVIASCFIVCLGILVLITSIIALQNALDLIALKDKIWGIWIVIALIFAACAISIIMNLFHDDSMRDQFTYMVLVADGVISLISTLYLFLRLKSFHKKQLQADKQAEYEDTETDQDFDMAKDHKTAAEETSSEEMVFDETYDPVTGESVENEETTRQE